MDIETRVIQRMTIEYAPDERKDVDAFMDQLDKTARVRPYTIVRSGPKMIEFGRADINRQQLVLDILLEGPDDEESSPRNSSEQAVQAAGEDRG